MSLVHYRGFETSALDSKGRFTLPAKFRAELRKIHPAEAAIQIRQDPARPYLQAFAVEQLDDFDAEHVKQRDLRAARGEDFDIEELDAEYYDSIKDVTMDSGGRFSIPPEFRKTTGIDTALCVRGAGRIIQLWKPETLIAAEGIKDFLKDHTREFLAALNDKKKGRS